MSKSNKDIVSASMHTTVFVAGMGQIGPQLSSTGSATSKAVKMTLEDNWVTCEVKNQTGTMITFLVPLTNFINLVPKKEAAVAKDSKA